MKKGIKIFLSIFLITIIVFLFVLIWDLFGFKYSTNPKHYKEVAQEHILPNIEDLPRHKSVKYKYYQKNFLIFFSSAYSMIVKYDEDTYNNQKAILYEPYENINEMETSNETDNPIQRNNEPIIVDEFSFEMYSEWYPHCIYFIGTNDKTNQIAYIYFEDMDLDTIDLPYSWFIELYCGW